MKVQRTILASLIALFALFAIASNHYIFTIACYIIIAFYSGILISMFDIKLYKLSYNLFLVRREFDKLYYNVYCIFNKDNK